MKQEKINWFEELKKAGKTAVKFSWKFAQVLMNILITILLIGALTGIIIGTAFTIYIKNNVNTEIDISAFQIGVSQGTTKTQMYYYEFSDRSKREGTPVLLDGENIVGSSDSTYVTYDQIPENMINAVVAIEDKRFFTHEGVDWKRTFGAALGFFTGSDTYGGSTLTQQLIKNITEKDDYSIQRKVQEMFYALDLETKMDKEQIIELYLNVANFGGNYYGVQAAARNYFNKNVADLTLIECAAIAGITQNPSKYNPKVNPDNNAERRNIVLYEMLEQGLITQREFEEAYGQTLVLTTPTSSESHTEQQNNGINSWYTDMVISDLIDDLVEEKGMNRSMASLLVYNGGLKIYSLVDPEIQKACEEVFLDDSNFSVEDSQSACIVIDPYTGDILGVCGKRGIKNANRIQNFATDTKKPSGSSIKPLSIYAPLIDQRKLTWATVTDDTPYNFEVKETGWPRNDEKWSGNNYAGLVNTEFAVTNSTNTVAVKLLSQFGLENSYNFCYNKLHMTDLIDSVTTSRGEVYSDKTLAALGLGQLTYGISLRQITAAYSIFPNQGMYNETHSYNLVTYADGTVLLEKTINSNVAISEEAACVMNHLLQNVPLEGTASTTFLSTKTGINFVRKDGYKNIDLAGKTGSTQDNYDRWFIGYTPYYICGVWTGSEYNNIKITVSNPSLKVFDQVMMSIHTGLGEKHFTESAKVHEYSYCKDSGLLYDPDLCSLDPRGSRVETGYFIDGTEPKEYCHTHVLVDYDYLFGGVSDGSCTPGYTKKVALVRVNRDFNCATDISILDAEYAFIDVGSLGYYTYSNTKPYYYALSSLKEEHVGADGTITYTYHRTGYSLGPKPGYEKSKSVLGQAKVQFNAACTKHYYSYYSPVLSNNENYTYAQNFALLKLFSASAGDLLTPLLPDLN